MEVFRPRICFHSFQRRYIRFLLVTSVNVLSRLLSFPFSVVLVVHTVNDGSPFSKLSLLCSVFQNLCFGENDSSMHGRTNRTKNK